MPVPLPYVASAGSLKNALDRIRAAATPTRITGDWVSNTLKMKGGAGAAIPPFLKRMGFVASDGTPTELYKQFRNDSFAEQAMAKAIMAAYAPLAAINEQFFDVTDAQLKDLIVQVTGDEKSSTVTQKIHATLKTLKQYANFKKPVQSPAVSPPVVVQNNTTTPEKDPEAAGLGLNLSYTINLNLPATSDQAVFNAIFKSLKEHLLSNG